MLHVIWKYFNAYNFESGPILQHSSHIVHQWWNLHISNSVSHAVRVTDTKKPPRSYRRTSSLIIHFQRKHTQDFAGFCILALIIYSSFPPPPKKKSSNHPELIGVRAFTVPWLRESGCSVFLDKIFPTLHLKSVCRAMCTHVCPAYWAGNLSFNHPPPHTHTDRRECRVPDSQILKELSQGDPHARLCPWPSLGK